MSDRTFGAMILTHGRPNKVVTYRSLRRHGYTGPIVLLIDDEDTTAELYRERFPEEVRVFSKAEIAARFDPADQSADRRTIVYARIAAFDVARELGWTHFIQLDDDYTTFTFRVPYRSSTGRQARPKATEYGHAGSVAVRDLDRVFEAMAGFLDRTGFLTVAMSQGGDHIGGAGAQTIRQGFKRKAMNSFVVRTDRPVPFVGRLNEDVNAYALAGSRGELFLTLALLQLEQTATQQHGGGMTETYLASGTYVKSFYTVMMCPAFASVSMMGRTDRRFHHRISWDNAVPKIVPPELRREAGSAAPSPEVRPAGRLPRYPVYIPSRGRANASSTARILSASGVPFRVVVEPHEADAYLSAVGRERVLVLPWDNPPGTRDGAVRSRNWILEHAAAEGAERVWQLDDDVSAFMRRRNRKRETCPAAELLVGLEDLADSFTNVGMVAPAFQTFIWNGEDLPSYRVNRYMAGIMLMRTEPYRFRALQDDLDMTLQVLSGGECTLLSYDFVFDTPTPGTGPGGASEMYAGEGRRLVVESVAELFPDLVEVYQNPKTGAWSPRLGRRWSRFSQRPIPREAVPDGP